MYKHYCDIVVVGGGIIGCAVAYYLSKKNKNVIILEKRFPASGASGACNGGLSYLGKKEKILDEAIESLYMYKDLERELETDLKKNQNRDILFIAENHEQLKLLNNLVEECKIRNLDARIIDNKQIRKIVPEISGHLIGGASAAGGLHGIVNPFNTVFGFLNRFKENGGKVFTEQKVSEVLVQNGMVFGVRNELNEVRASVVIVCAGYESDTLLKPLGFNCGLMPSKGTVLISENSSLNLKTNILSAGFMEENGNSTINLAIEQTLEGNILIGSSAELGITNLAVDKDIIINIAKNAVYRLPILRDQRIIRTFSGIRPVRKDGPFWGGIPNIKGLYGVFGHGGMGITLAPIYGKMLAELIN